MYIMRVCVSPPPAQPSPAEETSTQREWEPGTPAFHAVKRSGERREEGGGRKEVGGGRREKGEGRREEEEGGGRREEGGGRREEGRGRRVSERRARG